MSFVIWMLSFYPRPIHDRAPNKNDESLDHFPVIILPDDVRCAIITRHTLSIRINSPGNFRLRLSVIILGRKRRLIRKRRISLSCSSRSCVFPSGRFTFFRGNLRADQIYRRILQPGCYKGNIKSTSCFMIFSDILNLLYFTFIVLYIRIYNIIYIALRLRTVVWFFRCSCVSKKTFRPIG